MDSAGGRNEMISWHRPAAGLAATAAADSNGPEPTQVAPELGPRSGTTRPPIQTPPDMLAASTDQRVMTMPCGAPIGVAGIDGDADGRVEEVVRSQQGVNGPSKAVMQAKVDSCDMSTRTASTIVRPRFQLQCRR